jgi:ABC-type multidrug transport system fused ATPase/permease subunit
MKVPNPEQTASIFSLIVYSFLDPLVFEACRVPHLSHERLPAIPDYDEAKYLREKAFPHLDPFQGAKGHLFFRLTRVFCEFLTLPATHVNHYVQIIVVEYVWMSIAIIFFVLASFASPLALNGILSFVESNGQGASINPWFWIFCLFFGPIIMSISAQWYIFMGTRALALTEGLLTQLVFEHSLRIRFKAEGSKENSPSTVQSSSVAPETHSVEGSAVLEDSDTHSDTTASSTKGKGKADSYATKSVAAKDENKEEKKDNLVGMINTLVTVDLDNVVSAKDFLMVGLQVPLELVLAIIFLYAVLGWSAFVGCASIVLLLPAPGYLAAKLQTVQRKKMTVIDDRVQTITEVLGVLRMVKLFGWEHKMSETIKEKRDEELVWIWKDKVK